MKDDAPVLDERQEFHNLYLSLKDRLDAIRERPALSACLTSVAPEPVGVTRLPASILEPGIKTEGLDKLARVRQALGECRRCSLHITRSNIVFGEGNPRARLVFVGEAPGADEDLTGRPFVGKAGQLLTRIIGAMGLKREEVYICNILKCRPPGNRNPLPEEIDACEPFLIQQLAAIQPKVICALGSVATNALLKNDTPISALRGRFRTIQESISCRLTILHTSCVTPGQEADLGGRTADHEAPERKQAGRRTMKRNCLTLALLVLLLCPTCLGMASEKAPVFDMITVSSAITPPVAEHILQAIQEADRNGRTGLIVLLDTPGGLDLAMRDIAKGILNAPLPVLVFVYPSGARAASAGVIITVAAHVAAMSPGTNIGAAHPVAIGFGGGGDKTMMEKVENDAAAYVRGIAKKRGERRGVGREGRPEKRIHHRRRGPEAPGHRLYRDGCEPSSFPGRWERGPDRGKKAGSKDCKGCRSGKEDGPASSGSGGPE